VLTLFGLVLAAFLFLGPGLVGAQRMDAQSTNPSGNPSTTQLPHELEEQRQLESQWEKGLTDEQALDHAAQQQAIEESIRQHQETAPEPDAQIGFPHNAPVGGGRTASLGGHIPSQDLKALESLVRRELVPSLKAMGTDDADIEVMVRDLTQILAGGIPGR
jgi:hypothetical protein